jgi:hypothetical protein
MPRDLGAVTDETLGSAGVGMSEGHTIGEAPGIEAGAHVGEALRDMRRHIGRDLRSIADITCVRHAYLEAIEQMRFEALPSRPFIIGYIRAYAEAVGLDPDQAVGRFKRDYPERDAPLREPVGVEKKPDSRLKLIGAVGLVVFAAILVFNLALRAMSPASKGPASVAETATPLPPAAVSGQGPVALGAPTAPPQEATRPDPYVTPGLAASQETGGEVVGLPTRFGAQVPGAAPLEIAADAAPTFRPAGKIYGAPAGASAVTLQARRSAALIVHGQDGRVLFAEQLKTGEAYRAPVGQGISVDVSDPAAFNVYLWGQIQKPLPANVVPLSKISG